jgi:hypothetical protein
MPTYSFCCPAHGEFEVTVPVSQHRDNWPCPHTTGHPFYMCMERTEQTYTRSKPKDWAIKAIVVHVGADGAVRFPGHENARVPKGFNRVELKTLSEIAAFERQINQKLSSEASRHIENEERHFESVRARLRGELRQQMQSMSPFGRAFAQLAIAMNNSRKRKKSDVGFQVDILNNDNSSREAYRDKETNWKPTRWI